MKAYPCSKCKTRTIYTGTLCDLCKEKQKRSTPIAKSIIPTDAYSRHMVSAINHVELAIADFHAAREIEKTDITYISSRYLETLLHCLIKSGSLTTR